MNKRIRELAEQTSYIWHSSGDPQIYEFTPEKLEKFAELIVVECAMFVVTELEGKVGSAIADATANRLEKHFGVKE